jgi:hypothetical protein
MLTNEISRPAVSRLPKNQQNAKSSTSWYCWFSFNNHIIDSGRNCSLLPGYPIGRGSKNLREAVAGLNLKGEVGGPVGEGEALDEAAQVVLHLLPAKFTFSYHGGFYIM